MTARDETEKALTKRSVTKISGEPQAEDVTLLVRELAEHAAEVATTLGGDHGHLGLVIEDARYLALAGVVFNRPN